MWEQRHPSQGGWQTPYPLSQPCCLFLPRLEKACDLRLCDPLTHLQPLCISVVPCCLSVVPWLSPSGSCWWAPSLDRLTAKAKGL